MTDTPSVAQQVVAAIRAAGIDTLFCLPGVQNDDFFDVLVDAPDIRPIVSRRRCTHRSSRNSRQAAAESIFFD